MKLVSMSGQLAMVDLADVADLNPRMTTRPAAEAPVSFVGMAGLCAETAQVVREDVRPYREVAKGYTQFEDGDLLVAKITPCFENNKIGQANLSQKIGAGSTEFHVVRPKLNRADARYLLHFLRQDHIRDEGERRMTGSAGQRRAREFPGAFAGPAPTTPRATPHRRHPRPGRRTAREAARGAGPAR